MSNTVSRTAYFFDSLYGFLFLPRQIRRLHEIQSGRFRSFLVKPWKRVYYWLALRIQSSTNPNGIPCDCKSVRQKTNSSLSISRLKSFLIRKRHRLVYTPGCLCYTFVATIWLSPRTTQRWEVSYVREWREASIAVAPWRHPVTFQSCASSHIGLVWVTNAFYRLRSQPNSL